jgi:mRNA interferase RelE/StbE
LLKKGKLRNLKLDVKYSKQARKFLEKQEEAAEARIRKSINKLPMGDVVKLSGTPDTYRLRVGECRVIFKKEKDGISVYKIENRGQAYKE